MQFVKFQLRGEGVGEGVKPSGKGGMDGSGIIARDSSVVESWQAFFRVRQRHADGRGADRYFHTPQACDWPIVLKGTNLIG